MHFEKSLSPLKEELARSRKLKRTFLAANLAVQAKLLKLLLPGSFVANQWGCTCNMIANQFGLGAGTNRLWVDRWIIGEECPLHAKR